MRKKKIRALVGFPLGVFAGVTLFVVMGLFENSFSFGLIVSYFLAGFAGILSVSIATLLSDECDSILKEALIHACCTFALIFVLFFFLERMQSVMGVLGFLLLYFLVFIAVYAAVDLKTRKTVSQLNQLNDKTKSL